MKHLPNLLTVANAFFGGSAIFFLFQDRVGLTLICIGICLLADLLDGMVARALGVASPLGVQLDSLADVVSFGALPSCVLAWIMLSCGLEMPLWMLSLAFLITAASAWRLAKFNLDQRDHSVFHGLPTPASAMLVFGFLLMVYFEHEWWEVLMCNHVLFFALIILLPLLMLSDLRLWSFKGLSKPGGKVVLGAILLIFAVLALTTGVAAISLTIIAYVVLGLVNTMIKVY